MSQGNGAAAPATQMQIDPVETAKLALMFLARCDLKPPERQAFSHVEILMSAIANGEVIVMARAAPEAPPREAAQAA